MRDYLTGTHPFAGKKRIALFPGRRSRSNFDWAKPVVADNLYDNYLQPACKALGLGSMRFHDLRHTFATMNLSAGALHASEQVAGALQFRADTDYLRGLHP